MAACYVGNLAIAQGGCNVPPCLLLVARNRARGHAADLDACRCELVEEPIDSLSDGRSLAHLALALKGIGLARANRRQLGACALSGRLQRNLGAACQCRKVLSAGSPVEEDIGLHAPRGDAYPQILDLAIPQETGLRLRFGVPDATLGQHDSVLPAGH